MKKLLCLLAILAIVLSLTSCQTQEDKITCTECGASIIQSSNYCSNCGTKVGSTVETTSVMTSETTTSETTMLTKEEMLELAEDFDFEKMQNEYQANPVNADEKYCNKYYKFAGYVESISSEEVKLVPLNTILVSFTPTNSITVNLSIDEIKQLNTGEVINIVGYCNGISSDGSRAFMNSAYYIDNTIEFTGRVSSIPYDGIQIKNGDDLYDCRGILPSEVLEKNTIKNDDYVRVIATDINAHVTKSQLGKYCLWYDVGEVISITKNN